MGRWAQAARRGTSKALPATPQIVQATLDPGAFGPTDGVLTVTFDRPFTTNDATDLETAIAAVGTFGFAAAPIFGPGSLSATWQSTSFVAGAPATTRLDWTGTDGPIVFFDSTTLAAIVNQALLVT